MFYVLVLNETAARSGMVNLLIVMIYFSHTLAVINKNKCKIMIEC
jgi:hypothetical protein